jgi:hypothetical protein
MNYKKKLIKYKINCPDLLSQISLHYYYYYYTLPDRRIQLRGRKLYGVQQSPENIIVL